MDKRIEKTYTDLQSAMRQLLGTFSWDEITVNALCEKACISRSTFYSHFKNKDDLLDTLLHQFENAMRDVNNGRSIQDTKTFRFLPMLLNHVRENRTLFAQNNTSVGGYPVATRFRGLITRLVTFELKAVLESEQLHVDAVHYLSGGIYSALVDWSDNTKDSLHLDFLHRLDALNHTVLTSWEEQGRKGALRE